jgi:hypothetical protein
VIRAVIDTNVLVSGLLSPAGNEALILLAIHEGQGHPCFSEEILDEYAAVLARPKFASPPDDMVAVLGLFGCRGELFPPADSAFGGAGADKASAKAPKTATSTRPMLVAGAQGRPARTSGTALWWSTQLRVSTQIQPITPMIV